MKTDSETIFALASAPGRGGVAVVRVSGPEAGRALLTLAPDLKSLPLPRMATRVFLYASESNKDDVAAPPDRIDDGLALWFPGPASFTGEDVVELHVHGGAAVLDALLTSLSHLGGLRPANPGEFTRRAFEHGKMDLTAAEAIADLVDAETTAQRRQALAQMGGGLAALYDDWRRRLVGAMAFTEASIDFAEEDIPDDLVRQSLEAIGTVAQELRAHLNDQNVGERIRDGFRIALTGAPNVGKSSLMNALAKRDVAIVSSTAGTTRDAIEVPLDLGGFPAILIDTAGLRDSDDEIEQEGVRRARAHAAAADVRIVLLDASEVQHLSDAPSICPMEIIAVNKIDEAPAPAWVDGVNVLGLSVKSGAGLQDFISAMTARIRKLAGSRATATPPLTRARHRHALEACADALDRVLAGAELGADVEMVAEDLRLAAQALGRITGRVDVEELLDKMFRDFCIGK